MELWGEIAGTDETSINLSQAEKESLSKLFKPLPIDGPKFHAPIIIKNEVSIEHQCDPIIINTIQLLEYKRVLEKLLDTVSNYKVAIANGSLDKMPSLQPAPALPNIVKQNTNNSEDDLEDDVAPTVTRNIQLGGDKARQQLESAVIKISAAAGYQTAKQSAVQLLTDATAVYLKQFCSLLRHELDKRLEAAPDDTNGWSDALEHVCVQMNVGSRTIESHKYTVLALGEYYQDRVIRRHEQLVRDVKQMTAQYEAGTNTWGQDDIPEMHFPSSDEGAGGETYSLDHATPSLDVGMQMLQSLEASGDLDTPLSGDSYTVDRDTLDLSADTPGHSPNMAKKRRMESGNKYS